MFAVLSPLRKVLRPVAALAAAGFLAACDPSMMSLPGGAGSGGPTVDPGETVKVALLVPRSDPSAASIALAIENATRLAIAEAQGARIELAVYDTGGQAGLAQSQAQRAVDEGAQIILGPLRADAVNAAGVAVRDEGVNVLGFSNNPSIAGGNVFVLGLTFEDIAGRLMSYARRQGKQNVAIVYSNDVPGQFGRTAIEQAAARSGIRVIQSEAYDLSIEGVNAAAQRTAASRGIVDTVIITPEAQNAATPMLLQLLPENGLAPGAVQYVGLSRWDVKPALFSLPGAEGSWFAVPDSNSQGSFDQRYRAAYGETPHPLASLGYDGMTAITQLLRQGRSDALTGGALTRAGSFRGATGLFRLNADGTTSRALAVASVRNQQVVIIDPAPTNLGGAGF
ncbi:penicillin-binding protein activator [Thetidibacter halocola]|uniref:Penicillin-binding protein activator n=1 Tax=Thetidibacter halocola TaxID=2827239 RepID=A0A8J7WFR0_9RHOB|nr:penicillin-binding protein activator [Thetidibacter halocola]MBS0125534.1 penicillin-binding protein activator [Thetidibacter halocola]